MQRQLPIDGVETVHDIRGAGPARKIYLQVRDNSSGAAHPAILTADLEAGTVARLETAAPYNVLIQDRCRTPTATDWCSTTPTSECIRWTR